MKHELHVRVINQNGWWNVTCPDLGIGGSGVSEQEARIAFYRSFFSFATWAEKQKTVGEPAPARKMNRHCESVRLEKFVQSTMSTAGMSATH